MSTELFLFEKIKLGTLIQNKKIKTWLKALMGFSMLYFIYLMLEITMRYIPVHTDKHFLSIKQTEVHNVSYYLVAFYVHVFSSIFVLIAGLPQFSKRLMNSKVLLHRILGYVYIGSILFFAAPSGLVIGYFANGGWVSQILFMTLAVLWWYFTFKALFSIKRGAIKAHRYFMIRSYALTLSAITLRLWKMVLADILEWPPMDLYVLVAALAWLPNWALAEIYIYFLNRKIL